MPFDDKNIHSLDDFYLHVSEKLKNHTLPVDADVWQGIEEKLPPARRTVSGVWWWAASAAAVVIALLFLIQPFWLREVENEEFANRHQATQTAPPTKVLSQSKQENLSSAETENTSLYAQKSAPSKQVVAERERVSEQQPSLIAEYLRDRLKEKDAHEELSPVVSHQEEIKETPRDIAVFEQQEEATTTKTAPVIDAENKLKTETKLIARLGGGAGGLGGSFGSARGELYADAPIGTELGSDAKGEHNSLTPSDYSEIHHLPPISFSLMAEFPLNDVWSIETGLMYSFLASKYKKPNGNIYTGTLSLHYVGVPVNVKVNLFQNNLWRIYLLGGGSVEKGISSVYKQTIQYQNGPDHHLVKRTSIKGWQFSSHVAAGFDYRINENIRLFGEPHIIYYFNNNQPMSARTENPLTFGLNMGVRIQF